MGDYVAFGGHVPLNIFNDSFGKVYEGLEVIDEIRAGDKIEKITIVED